MPEHAPAPHTGPHDAARAGAGPATRPGARAALTTLRLAALFTFLAVALGAVVCATGSGAACPTWPGCRPGQVAPQWQWGPLIEFTHRVVAIVAGPLLLAAAAMAGRLPGAGRRVRLLPVVALVGAVASGAFGRLVVLAGLPAWAGAIDLFCALAAMTLMAVAAVVAGGRAAPWPTAPWRAAPWRREPAGPLAALGVTVVIAVHVSGILAAGPGSLTRCMGWPLWRVSSSDLHPSLQGVRLGLAGLAAMLVVATALAAVRTPRLRPWGVAVVVLLAAEQALGPVLLAGQPGPTLATCYSVLAVALLWCLALLATLAATTPVTTGTTGTAPEPTLPPRSEPVPSDSEPVPAGN